jgi:membrane protein implicated in regulation of membrane protease activity
MMFGLVGLALHRQTGWDPTRSIIGASLTGFLTVWMLKWLFNAARKLQSSGNIKLTNAIGQEGTVYLSIPSTGTGKVQIKVQDHLKILDAVSEGEVEIKTGDRIRVIRIVSNNIMVVGKID